MTQPKHIPKFRYPLKKQQPLPPDYSELVARLLAKYSTKTKGNG